MPSCIEVSTSIGGDTNVVSNTPAPSRELHQDIATQFVYGDGHTAPFQQSDPVTNIDHLFEMYDQNSAASPLRQGTSSSSTSASIPTGRLGSDM